MFPSLSSTIQVAPIIVLLTLIFAALVMPKLSEMIGKFNTLITLIAIVTVAIIQLS